MADVKEKLKVAEQPAPRVTIDQTREPIVVVDDLHIKYRVYGAAWQGQRRERLHPRAAPRAQADDEGGPRDPRPVLRRLQG